MAALVSPFSIVEAADQVGAELIVHDGRATG